MRLKPLKRGQKFESTQEPYKTCKKNKDLY